MTIDGFNGNCDLDLAKLNGDHREKVEWIEVDQGKVDLRKSLVYCDTDAVAG